MLGDDSTISNLMQLMVLFDTSARTKIGTNLSEEDMKKANHIQEKYTSLLHKYLVKKMDRAQASKSLAKLIFLMPALQSLIEENAS